ncbi:hypothetical protein DFH06DRAFT_1297509 [Mycena polygramma]|nr:hypothetical protein DFH06DRAFT_1297509 [Mycena polygramma]
MAFFFSRPGGRPALPAPSHGLIGPDPLEPDADPPGFWADLDSSESPQSESQVSTDTPTKSEVQPTASDPTNSSMETDRSPRQRKASLTDGVPVRRIAAVDPAEQFEDVTQSLNDKISNKKREKTPT